MHVNHIARLGLILTGLTALGLATTARAQTTVFSTFGPGNTFNTVSAYSEDGPTSFSGLVSQGAAFSPSASGALSTVTVAYLHQVGAIAGTDDAHLYLTDSFSNLGNPAASLETFFFTPSVGFPGTIMALPAVHHPVLTAGQIYYLYGFEPGNELNNWSESLPPVNGTFVNRLSNGSYISINNPTLPAFSIQETAVPAVVLTPESSGLANLSGGLLALGTAGLLLHIRRRKAKPSA